MLPSVPEMSGSPVSNRVVTSPEIANGAASASSDEASSSWGGTGGSSVGEPARTAETPAMPSRTIATTIRAVTRVRARVAMPPL